MLQWYEAWKANMKDQVDDCVATLQAEKNAAGEGRRRSYIVAVIRHEQLGWREVLIASLRQCVKQRPKRSNFAHVLKEKVGSRRPPLFSVPARLHARQTDSGFWLPSQRENICETRLDSSLAYPSISVA